VADTRGPEAAKDAAEVVEPAYPQLNAREFLSAAANFESFIQDVI
jgi:hypothetical protein